MLLILAVLLFPCAIVGAFVTADDRDLTAFQTAGFFSVQPLAGASVPLHGRSPTNVAAKDAVSSRRAASTASRSTRRDTRSSPVTMLIGGVNSVPTTGSTFGRSGSVGHSDDSHQTHASTATPLLWPGPLSNGGAMSDISPSRVGRSRRRGRSFSSGSSDSALRAMAIPARCALPSVDLLREAYGPRRSFWGDLTPAETRRFYHELLPVSMHLEALGGADKLGVDGDERPLGGGASGGGLAAVMEAMSECGEWECAFGGGETLEERARMASMSRHAARTYVRERCQLPSRVVSHLYDGLRHLKKYGSFRVTGMTWEQLWDKYEAQIRKEDPQLEGEDLKSAVCLRILLKSCCTNEMFNNLAGCSELNGFLPAKDEQADSKLASPPSEKPSSRTPTMADSSSTSSKGGSIAGDQPDAQEALAKETAETKAIATAYAAERAAACAGALRLTRLVRPFRAVKAKATARRRARDSRARKSVGRPRISRTTVPPSDA